MISTRRDLVRRAGSVALAAGFLAAGSGSRFSGLRLARAATPDNDLMNPGPFPDRFLGSPQAPVTIIEYASMTCPHCAQFAISTYPLVKTRLIDTGRVRYTIRLFVLDEYDAAAAMVARASGDRYFEAVEVLLQRQREWMSDRIQPLMTLAISRLGFTPQTFKACLDDRELWKNVIETRVRGHDLGVTGVPAFFVNGKKARQGFMTIAEIEEAVAQA